MQNQCSLFRTKARLYRVFRRGLSDSRSITSAPGSSNSFSLPVLGTWTRSTRSPRRTSASKRLGRSRKTAGTFFPWTIILIPLLPRARRNKRKPPRPKPQPVRKQPFSRPIREEASKSVQLPVLRPEITHVGLDGHRAAGDPFHQLRGGELRPVPVDVFGQPAAQGPEFSPLHFGRNFRMGFESRFIKETAQDVAQGVSLKHPADHFLVPVHILKDAGPVVRRLDSQ